MVGLLDNAIATLPRDQDDELHAEWRADLLLMADRIAAMRVKLVAALEARGGGGRQWSHITDQIGMFAFTGLSGEEVDRLLDEHGVYLTRDGRMSLAGLSTSKVDVVADAIVSVLSK